MPGPWYSAPVDPDPTGSWFTADVERAAEGIATADGKSYALLTASERDRYLNLAAGALIGIGLERD